MNFVVPATSANMGPGFDSLGIALKFYNSIEIAPSSFFSVSLHGESARYLKTGDGNIFINIFNKTYERLTGSNGVFRFKFTNNIPLSRGLGSSSAVIVSALLAARVMADTPIDKREILNEALTYESHPDNITPAVFGGFCVSAVENGEVFFSRAELDADLRAVVTIPNKPISTRQSRSALPKKLKLQDAAFNISRSSLLTAALILRDYETLRGACEDRIHQHIRMRFLPALFEVKKRSLRLGALMSSLSGSGSSFFSLARDQDSAEKITAGLRADFPYFRTEIFELDNSGARFQESKV